MSNKELIKLIAALGKLGYQVVSVNPEKTQSPDERMIMPSDVTVVSIIPVSESEHCL